MRSVFMALLGIAVFSTNVEARQLTVLEKLEDFHSLTAQLRSGYGPLEYKRDVMGINLSAVEGLYEDKIKATTTNAAYYYTLVKFVAEFRDGHFGLRIPTTHRSTLPFMAELVDGKVLIDTIDRDKLSEADFPFQRGDEITAFNGRPIQVVMDDLGSYISSGRPDSVQRIAAWDADRTSRSTSTSSSRGRWYEHDQTFGRECRCCCDNGNVKVGRIWRADG